MSDLGQLRLMLPAKAAKSEVKHKQSLPIYQNALKVSDSFRVSSKRVGECINPSKLANCYIQ